MKTGGGEMEAELVDLIGITATIALVENFGGTRLFVPATVREGKALVAAVGIEAATKLSKTFSPDVIKVPIARELRAIHYRGQGLSNAKIALRLCVTEGAIDKMFQRLAKAGAVVPRVPKVLHP